MISIICFLVINISLDCPFKRRMFLNDVIICCSAILASGPSRTGEDGLCLDNKRQREVGKIYLKERWGKIY